MKKFYNFETMFHSLASKLTEFLYTLGCYFEISENGRYKHFEIYATPNEAKQINDFLNDNTIWCVGV